MLQQHERIVLFLLGDAGKDETLLQLLSCLDIIAPALLVDVCWQNLMLKTVTIHSYLLPWWWLDALYVCVYVYGVSFIAFVNDGLVLFVVVTAIFLLLLLFCYNNNVDGNLFCLLFLKIMCILYPDRDQHKMLQAELFYFFCLIFFAVILCLHL